LHQRLTQNRNTWNNTRKHEKVQNYQFTRRGELPYSPWRANIAPCYTITRRGEWIVSKHYSLSRIARRGEQATRGGEHNKFSIGNYDFLTLNTQFSSTIIPNLLETQPWIILQPEQQLSMESTVFLQLLQPILHVLSSNPILNPNSQFTRTTTYYMLNSVSESHSLRLENISPTLTLD